MIKGFRKITREPEEKDIFPPKNIGKNKEQPSLSTVDNDKIKLEKEIRDSVSNNIKINGVFIGIGSNMDNRVQYCAESIRRIQDDGRTKFLAVSSLYVTSPVSPVPQEDFVNCALELGWNGSPKGLLSFLNGIEHDMGRVRLVAKGPRVIDLDILLFGDLVFSTPALTIPHPQLLKRKFALLPCLEINPSLVHPLYKKPLSSFLKEIDKTQKISPYLPAVQVNRLITQYSNRRRIDGKPL
ncbi:MAG: 2-amino-4-hydroxy-6-hydroxymethyldihydropteridine diphosphokinase [Syntrophobacterales bacterium]|jgi:2-amino-4-hydroxy-6-hydroxymethyldihydropteridine diphosphokinase|nr:2-amino-4-hydroxy-6-hydroxymethyldihydropteridine diphosphokinase [Syntrophobacterales bacterium]